MTKRPSIKQFIDYHPDVGPLQALSCGFPGSGKSNHASSVVTKCLQDRPGYKGEMAIMHGDMACEWRHYLNFSEYVKKIILVFPQKIVHDVQRFHIPKSWKKFKVAVEEKTIDLEDPEWQLVSTEYMEPNSITVLYDDCFPDEDRTLLWTKIAYQLAYRTVFIDQAITYICHEAHEIFPQTAAGKQWRAIQEFISYFSLWRKRLIRAILICHQESEVFERLRKKCYWKFYRDSFPTSHYMREVVYKNIFNTTIETYHLFKGMLYRADNKSEKLKEINQNWLMIPRILINLNGEAEGQPAEAKKMEVLVYLCPHCGAKWKPRIDNPERCPRCYKYLHLKEDEEITDESN